MTERKVSVHWMRLVVGDSPSNCMVARKSGPLASTHVAWPGESESSGPVVPITHLRKPKPYDALSQHSKVADPKPLNRLGFRPNHNKKAKQMYAADNHKSDAID
jgi:hypothetical protein